MKEMILDVLEISKMAAVVILSVGSMVALIASLPLWV